MSTSLSAPDLTSPTLPVTLSDHASTAHHSSSTQKSEEITSPGGDDARQNGYNHLVNGESKHQSSQRRNSLQLLHDVALLDSAATTPRLTPSRHGSDDLHLIPSHELDGTHPTPMTALPRSLPSSKERPSPSPRSPRAALTTSFSELHVSTFNRYQSTLQQTLQPADKESILGRINPPRRSSQHPASHASSPPFLPTRTRSHGAMTDSRSPPSLAEDPIDQNRTDGTQDQPAQQDKEPATKESRNRSTSRSGKVEKRIEATLAKAEPSTTARSRKSSHLLGLFKENAAQEPKKLPDKVSSPLASVLKDGQESPRTALPAAIDKDILPHERSFSPKRQDRVILPDQRAQVSKSEPNVSEQTKHEEPPGAVGTPQHAPGGGEKRISLDTAEKEFQHHELAIPSQSKSDPRKTQAQQKPTPPIHVGIPLEDEADVSDVPDPGTPVEQEHPESSAERETEEESDKEEISSALYYPHQAPSPEALEGCKDVRTTLSGRTEHDDLERLPGPGIAADYDDDARSEEVDIAIQSQNQQRYLHGDLPKTKISQDDALNVESGLSSASESEYESFDESGRSTSGDEANVRADAELTPRASPGTLPGFLRPKRRKGVTRPAAPFGAVELKPYTHQVGGHSTVYKFSKRAVCKPLSNRENEFYEVIESQHPELLKFLPRYEHVPSYALKPQQLRTYEALSYPFTSYIVQIMLTW